ncbi:sucrase ferredoxin [Devosia geojensis]|uniref:sucrase ferredoxin n=1 Tax=Devosia geojensis TaxID=443610 RepID=UPI0006977734|nr:sucrase ferredoxin [Devosia geojensis]
MTHHVFCRDLCLERGEPLPGTGNIAERVLILAWPRGKWRVPRFESVGMEPALAEAVRLAMKAGIHVALVDRVGETQTLPSLLADGVAADFADQDALADAVVRFTAGEMFEGRRDERTVILCCTDSRRDACCARYGFATFKALMAAADPEKFNVLQATHVGGCRFAASLVVLPQRQRYGRVAPEQAAEFLATIARGDIYLAAYRGRTGLPQPAQVAEHAAMQWAQDHGLDQTAVRLGETAWPQSEAGGDVLTVSATAGDTPLELHLVAETIPVHGKCEGLAEKAPEMTPRWRLASIHAHS